MAPAHDWLVPDASFDVLACTQVLEHLTESWAADDEVRRVLKPRGRVVVTGPTTWYLHELADGDCHFTADGLTTSFIGPASSDLRWSR